MARWERKPRVNKGYREWPAAEENLSPVKVVELYNRGYAGTLYDPEARVNLFGPLAGSTEVDGEKIAYEFGLAGTGEGKLSIPFLPAYKHWPKMWPCPGQTTGDCVSHAGKNAALVLIGMEYGTKDEETLKTEGWPVVSALAEEQGVVACEPIYGYRGHGGQGASCERLIQYTCKVGGIHLRQNYPDLNLDLTNYKASIGINWGRSGGPPSNVNEEGKKHQIRKYADCDNHEIVRDFIANGYPIWACSGLGWSSSRDENGYSVQRGGWSHSWIVMGYDDRTETKSKYGGPLFLYNHDWGRWNSGGRRILGTDIDIPEGSFWGKAELLNRCDCTAMSNLNGWPTRSLDNMFL